MKPRRLFRVEVKRSEGEAWRYAERGGGTYFSEKYARESVEHHRRRGREARLFVTECHWREVDSTEPAVRSDPHED